jgi:hypothetical protein
LKDIKSIYFQRISSLCNINGKTLILDDKDEGPAREPVSGNTATSSPETISNQFVHLQKWSTSRYLDQLTGIMNNCSFSPQLNLNFIFSPQQKQQQQQTPNTEVKIEDSTTTATTTACSTKTPVDMKLLFMGDEFGESTCDVWESTVLNSCTTSKKNRNVGIEEVVLEPGKQLSFTEVLGRVSKNIHQNNAGEVSNFLRFVSRIDGFKCVSAPTTWTNFPRHYLGLESSNIFFFEVPVRADQLETSLQSGRNTLVPLMKESKFNTTLNLDFVKSTTHGASLFACLTDCVDENDDDDDDDEFYEKDEDVCFGDDDVVEQITKDPKLRCFMERCEEELRGINDKDVGENDCDCEDYKCIRNNNWLHHQKTCTSSKCKLQGGKVSNGIRRRNPKNKNHGVFPFTPKVKICLLMFMVRYSNGRLVHDTQNRQR